MTQTLHLGPCGCEVTYTLEDVVAVDCSAAARDFIKGLHHCEEADVD